MFLYRRALRWIVLVGSWLYGFHATREDDEFSKPELKANESPGVCPGDELDARSVAELHNVQRRYERSIDSQSFIGDESSWFIGGPPQLNRGWADMLMMPQFVLPHDKKETAKAWSNQEGSTPWRGSFWATSGRSDIFSSSFGTVPGVAPEQLVVAKSIPILGLDGSMSLKVGAGFGTVATSFRKGRCDGLSSSDEAVWDQLKRAPANVFLTTYNAGGTDSLASSRKQVRHGSLAFKFGSKTNLLQEAAARLRELVGYSLASPFASPVPRVRFTQLMANYAWIAGQLFVEPEEEYITDQAKVIDLFKQDLDRTALRYDNDTLQLHSRDVVELYYTANVFGTPGPRPFHENFKHSRHLNTPGLFTYLRWIAEDTKQLAERVALPDEQATSFLKLAKETALCPGKSKGTDTFTSAKVGQGWVSEWTSELIERIEEQRLQSKRKGQTSTLKCWNRHLRLFLQHMEEVAPPAEQKSVRRLQDALDLLYQLAAQRKENSEDAHSCGQSKWAPGALIGQDGCSFAHRTSELLQLAVLDSLLGVAVTFSNCKSGLDRTGIYHALQSAVDQLFALYPGCSTTMAYLAIHFTSVTDRASQAPTEPLRAAPQCRAITGSVLRLDSMIGKSSWKHMYNLLRNAILKNLLEVGIKVTYSSTGLSGLKYGGELASKALKEAMKQAQNGCKGKDCAPLDPDSKANPMVAPFLPPRVTYEVGHSTPGSPASTDAVMTLTQKYNGELYIANALTLGRLTAVSLLEDASKYRGS